MQWRVDRKWKKWKSYKLISLKVILTASAQLWFRSRPRGSSWLHRASSGWPGRPISARPSTWQGQRWPASTTGGSIGVLRAGQLAAVWPVKSCKLMAMPSSEIQTADLSIYPSIHLSIYPFIHLSIYPSINLSIYPSIHSSIHLSIYPSIHLSICPSVHLSIYPSIYQSIYPSIHPSICL